jgi:aspartate ammonia-lyase
MTNKRPEFRTEKDSLGEMSIPSQCYWGVKTARAQAQLYSGAGLKMHPKLIESVVTVKKVMAIVNQELGRLDAGVSRALAQASDEVLSGRWRDQFVVGPFQSNAGSVFDVNVNEVLANRAEELLGGEPGQYKLVKPDHHINLGLVRSEVLAVAMRLAVLSSLKEFEPAVLDLERLLRRKAVELAKAAKAARAGGGGDASPALLEQAFNSFGSAVERGLKRIKEMSLVLADVQVGSSPAITGGANLEYASRLLEKLSKLTGLKLRLSEETGRSSPSVADFLHVSSSLKELAVELSKIANDLRQLGVGSHLHFLDGPVALEAEHIPVQTNQSDQMGAAEALGAMAFQVMGNDLATALACQSGQPQLNVVSPMVVNNLLQSIDLLHQSVACFNQRFLVAITTEADRTRPSTDLGSHFFALLSEHVGLERSRQLYEEFSGSSKDINEALEQRNMVPPEVLEKLSKHAQPDKGHLAGGTNDSPAGEKRGDDRA